MSIPLAQVMAEPKKHRRNIVADLTKDSDDGTAFTKEDGTPWDSQGWVAVKELEFK